MSEGRAVEGASEGRGCGGDERGAGLWSGRARGGAVEGASKGRGHEALSRLARRSERAVADRTHKSPQLAQPRTAPASSSSPPPPLKPRGAAAGACS
ncbi:unnamed protein product [Lampetra fluviatilis]